MNKVPETDFFTNIQLSTQSNHDYLFQLNCLNLKNIDNLAGESGCNSRTQPFFAQSEDFF